MRKLSTSCANEDLKITDWRLVFSYLVCIYKRLLVKKCRWHMKKKLELLLAISYFVELMEQCINTSTFHEKRVETRETFALRNFEICLNKSCRAECCHLNAKIHVYFSITVYDFSSLCACTSFWSFHYVFFHIWDKCVIVFRIHTWLFSGLSFQIFTNCLYQS